MNDRADRATLKAIVGERGLRVRFQDILIFADALRDCYPRVAHFFMDLNVDPTARFVAARYVYHSVRCGGLVYLDEWEQSLPH